MIDYVLKTKYGNFLVAYYDNKGELNEKLFYNRDDLTDFILKTLDPNAIWEK